MALAHLELEAGVVVARQFGPDFACLGAVPQDQPAELEFFRQRAAAAGFHFRIVIAGDPDPVDRTGQRVKHPRGVLFEPGRSGRIVEIVAQRYDPPRARFADRQRHAFQRFAAVIGRDQLPVAREETAFFQMQVGYQQRAFARPVQRAAFGEEPFLACERKGNHGSLLP